MTAKEALSSVLFDAPYDVATLDAWYSISSQRFIDGLKAGPPTQLVLDFGSLDPNIPFGTLVEYLEKLRAQGVPVEAWVNVRGGHYWSNRDAEFRIWSALRTYVDPSVIPSWRYVDPGIHFRRSEPAGTTESGVPVAQMVPFDPPTGTYPFTLEVARQQFVGQPAHFIASGPPNTTYAVYMNGNHLFTRTIPPGRYFDDVGVSTSTMSPGTHPITVFIGKNGAPPTQPVTITPTYNAAPFSMTLVPYTGQDWNDIEVRHFYMKNNEGVWAGISETNWGVSEF